MPITPEHAAQVRAEADCLYDREQVGAAVDRMATEITARIGGRNPLVLCVMNGALMVTAELLVRLDFPLELDYLHATRYRGETSGGALHWFREPSVPLEGRVVLVVDDILDEGPTLAAIREYCAAQGAAEVLAAVLVDKVHDRRAPGAFAEFIGIQAPDRYLFGYGMDYKEYLRNAPGIFAVRGM